MPEYMFRIRCLGFSQFDYIRIQLYHDLKMASYNFYKIYYIKKCSIDIVYIYDRVLSYSYILI